LIALRHDWYQLKGLPKGFKLVLRLWKSLKNWWRYDQMKFVTLTHWVLDAQLTVETDASDYALAAILSIITKNNEIHPVAFHS